MDGAVFEEDSSCTLPISREGTEDVQAAGAPGKGRAQSSVPGQNDLAHLSRLESDWLYRSPAGKDLRITADTRLNMH